MTTKKVRLPNQKGKGSHRAKTRKMVGKSNRAKHSGCAQARAGY